MNATDVFESRRTKMVAEQIRRRGIIDERLLQVMRETPRHLFVPENMQDLAYEDGPLSIGFGQTISQPYIVAFMTNLLALKGEETILEVGTGSGYQAAILARLGRCVHTVEQHPGLAERAGRILASLGLDNVFIHVGDGSAGWPANAPYQRIIVTAAAPRAPRPLIEQLDQDGRLVIPVGSRLQQDLELWVKEKDDLTCERLLPVAFVPLRGAYGWKDDEWEETLSY